MQTNANRFAWTKPRQTAALEVAKDEIGDREIAQRCGINVVTLERWKLLPEFQARVEQHRKDWREKIRRRGIAEKQNRVDALNDRWSRLQQVVAARAKSAKMKRVAGGKTGLLAHQVRGVGGGDNFREVDYFEVDTGLLREMREHEKQAAQELGEWVERREDLTKYLDLTKLSDAQLERIARGEDPIRVVLGT